ncbi:unnamed protein product [Moneuplotes crassus]|uniref:START domain-containing protein n=1 Tax=Euplotes crassus TaxID=5936 RepID=A0AAD1XDM8_EUPCR|nr:unnamed protein product [Moneuplotes crassus]
MEGSLLKTSISTDAATLLPAEPTLDDAGSQEALDLMLKAREKFAEGIALLNEEDWISNKDEEKAKFWVRKPDEDGFGSIRREAIFNKSAADVDEWFSKQANLVDSSDILESSEIISELNSDSLLVRRQMKGNDTYEPRDLAVFCNRIALTDGSIGHVIFSVTHDSIPETDCVRAETKVHLGILQPISDTSCVLVSAAKIDPKATIPPEVGLKMLDKQYEDFVKMMAAVEA